MKSKTLVLSALSLMTAVSLLSGCAGGGGWQMPPPAVETVQARQQPWIITYSTSGTLEANNKVDLNTETPGTITRIYATEGQAVGRGQILMRLKADKQVAQVQESVAGISSSLGNIEQQKADIQQAQARLNSAATRRKLAQSDLDRFQKLYQDQFVSQWELDQKRSAFDTAEAAYQEAAQALSSARARASQATSSLNQAKSSYRYSVAVADESIIRAPFSGVVGQKYVDQGDYANTGEKLMTVVDPSQFKIQFNVPERYLSQMFPGTAVTAKFEGLGARQFAGRVNFIDPVVDPGSHTVAVKALLPGGTGLRHGMFGTVALSLGTIANAVVVPEEAIVPQGEKTFVYVIKHEVPKDEHGKPKGQATTVAHLREVLVGHREAGLAQIDSGLAAGEEVITSGLQKVNDSQAVNVQNGSNATVDTKVTKVEDGPLSPQNKGH